MTGGAREPTAEDHERLQRNHADVVEQLVAADAVLIALGRSSADSDAVLDTVAESARRLCRCQGVQIYLFTVTSSSWPQRSGFRRSSRAM